MTKLIHKSFILILQLIVLYCDNYVQPVQYDTPPHYNSPYVVNSPIKVYPFYNQVSSPQYPQSLGRNVQRVPSYYMYPNVQPLYFSSNVHPYQQQQQDSYNLNYRGGNGFHQHQVNPDNQILGQYVNNQFQQVSQIGGGGITYQNDNQNIPYQNQYSSPPPPLVGHGQQQQQSVSSYVLPTPIQPNYAQPYNNNGFIQGPTNPPVVGYDPTFNYGNNNNKNNNENFQYSAATWTADPSNFRYEVSGPGVISQYQFNQGKPAGVPPPPPSQLDPSGPSGPSGPGNFPQSASSNTATVVEQFRAIDKTKEFEDLIKANIIQQQNNDGQYPSTVTIVLNKNPKKSEKPSKEKEMVVSSLRQPQNNSQVGRGSSRTTTTTTKRPKTTAKQSSSRPTTTTTTTTTTSSSETKVFGQRLSPIKSFRNRNKTQKFDFEDQ